MARVPKGKNNFFLVVLTNIQVTFETDAAHNRVEVWIGTDKNPTTIAEAENVDFSNTITTFEVKITKCDSRSGICTIS